jgi:hypothetical protein
VIFETICHFPFLGIHDHDVNFGDFKHLMYISSVMYRKDADTDIFQIKERVASFNFYKSESPLSVSGTLKAYQNIVSIYE